MVAYRPDAGVGYAFVINSSNEAAENEIDALVRGYLTVDAPHPTPPPAAPISSLARAGTGWYIVDNPRWQRFYFLDRMQSVVRVRADDSSLTLDPVLGDAQRYIPVSETLFRGPNEPVATLALVDDAANARPASWELVVYILPISLRRISAATAYLTICLGAAFCLITVVSLVFGLAPFLVGVLRNRRYGNQVWLSVWPFVAALSVIVCYPIVEASREDAFTRFGEPTVWSIGLFVCISLFAVSSVLGLVTAVRSPVPVRSPMRLHALVAGLVNGMMVAYLAWWGVLGWRIWA